MTQRQSRKQPAAPRLCLECKAEMRWYRGTIAVRCAPCANRTRAANRTPERAAEIEAARRARKADPEFQRMLSERISAAIQAKLASDPAFAEMKRETGRRVGNTKRGNPPPGSPSRVAGGRLNTERRLAAIPMEYRDTYRQLLAKKVKAKDARKMIAAMAKARAARFHRTGKLDPLDQASP